MSNKIYYKGLDENLCGLNGYQYEVGKEYSADTYDKFHWLHFAEKVSDAFPYGSRIVEVEPLTKANRYSAADMNAERVRILRELSGDEIIDRLFEENYPPPCSHFCCICPTYWRPAWRHTLSLYLMDKIRPTYEQLLRHKDRIKRRDHRSILHWDWLTADQKRELIPKSWERYIRASE